MLLKGVAAAGLVGTQVNAAAAGFLGAEVNSATLAFEELFCRGPTLRLLVRPHQARLRGAELYFPCFFK